ncbi:hypothetical protein [Bordetella avium]|uniref:hypothetical protein n=1 Tax=Bordetella avium TaxID=521 RepID=UPI000E18EBD5|nr:hypothetical protein [Bordetella avium]RIQ30131.1 hypothetical protein D0849_16410 [Bordetella avium]RIQ41558.1 hypothetical protein D0848_03575 [Bordetella avium]RIQ44869.1 hypothetical protein D0845_17465 [Bordetella avium]RIQ55265.1 hypothetical protein D0841_16875 [Bordetella avium]RIQ65230.1 hypothetical protein D0839_16990 [Bordetella avium]
MDSDVRGFLAWRCHIPQGNDSEKKVRKGLERANFFLIRTKPEVFLSPVDAMQGFEFIDRQERSTVRHGDRCLLERSDIWPQGALVLPDFIFFKRTTYRRNPAGDGGAEKRRFGFSFFFFIKRLMINKACG